MRDLLIRRWREATRQNSENGTPGRIRTCDPRLRRPMLRSPTYEPVGYGGTHVSTGSSSPCGHHVSRGEDATLAPIAIRVLSRLYTPTV